MSTSKTWQRFMALAEKYDNEIYTALRQSRAPYILTSGSLRRDT